MNVPFLWKGLLSRTDCHSDPLFQIRKWSTKARMAKESTYFYHSKLEAIRQDSGKTKLIRHVDIHSCKSESTQINYWAWQYFINSPWTNISPLIGFEDDSTLPFSLDDSKFGVFISKRSPLFHYGTYNQTKEIYNPFSQARETPFFLHEINNYMTLSCYP